MLKSPVFGIHRGVYEDSQTRGFVM